MVLARGRGQLGTLGLRKGDPGKVMELLATLVAVRLWVPDGDAKKTSRVAIRGYTDNQSNESLLRSSRMSGPPRRNPRREQQ